MLKEFFIGHLQSSLKTSSGGEPNHVVHCWNEGHQHSLTDNLSAYLRFLVSSNETYKPFSNIVKLTHIKKCASLWYNAEKVKHWNFFHYVITFCLWLSSNCVCFSWRVIWVINRRLKPSKMASAKNNYHWDNIRMYGVLQWLLLLSCGSVSSWMSVFAVVTDTTLHGRVYESVGHCALFDRMGRWRQRTDASTSWYRLQILPTDSLCCLQGRQLEQCPRGTTESSGHWPACHQLGR